MGRPLALATRLSTVLALGLWGCSAPDPAPSRTNVVVFLIDTLRADRLGLYGYPQPTSPYLDDLASRSVVFEQASAPAPWTVPSAPSILLSSFACEHGVLRDGDRLSPASQPLALRLAKDGYRTASFFSNPYAGSVTGLDRGFELSQQVDGQIDGGMIRSWLGSLGSEPFFLYVHNTEPHNPYRARADSMDLFGVVPRERRQAIERSFRLYRRLTRADHDQGLPLGTTDNTEQQAIVLNRLEEARESISRLYDATVREADAHLRSVITALQEASVWDDTLLIVLSDHGEEMGEHGGWLHDQSVYEELIHVPLLIRFPGDAHAGRRIASPVSLVDVVPTILDFLERLDGAKGLGGESLMPFVRGDPGATSGGRGMRVTAMRHNVKKFYRPFKRLRGDRNLVVRQGSWKGIWNEELGTLELYDLESDPGEQTDLAPNEPRRSEAMQDFARHWLSSCTVSVGGGATENRRELDDDTRRRLESLGYIDPARPEPPR